ncbi:MAG: hypothetical protein IPM57_00945 [Oligoflexia bacterium]|nr:hypothetical protein [Oligoflexia bacterium]
MGILKGILVLSTALAGSWDQDELIPAGGRQNVYNLSQEEYLQSINQGKIHAQIYPVDVTGILPPLRPIQNFLEKDSGNPLKAIFQNLFKEFTGVHSINDIFKWVGLHPYPKESDQGVYAVPYPNGKRPNYLMGYGVIKRDNVDGFTASCASCHSANLFGKTVLGLTNRFPRANETFYKAKIAVGYVNPYLFKVYNRATANEVKLLEVIKENVASIGTHMPLVLGLDTSLAQVSSSLNRRENDSWATKNKFYEKHPRRDDLEHMPADSKPAVWWNIKYKNRWLSDGSIISGNPIFTNILWNELGRGTDLRVLDKWIDNNKKALRDLTNAVFSIQAPRVVDFFEAERINLERAKRGERLFNLSCAKCHGVYEKAWNAPGNELLPYSERLKTTQVIYRKKTPVVDVGTDPERYKQMKLLEKLNDLEISKKNGTVVIAQKGYVPPPLVGIWARWPYFHNNSVPTLCDVLNVSHERPSYYFAGEANDPNRDFDFECNGYPIGDKTPPEWKKKMYFFDTTRLGMGNRGHDQGILIKNGQEILSVEDKKDLIQFMQTL